VKNRERKNCLGVVGGMGPLASAEFLRTIYEYSLADRPEQDAPVVMLYSDPTVPDRTEAFLKGGDEPVLAQLNEALQCLVNLGAAKIVICCMTSHYLLPRVPASLRGRVISMLDVIFERVAEGPRRRRLVFCSNGTRKLRLFENHSRWEQFKDCIVFPDEQDQRRIHDEIIYPIKRAPALGEFASSFQSLLAKYEVDSFIAGCSEIHLLAKYFITHAEGQKAVGWIDPLDTVARELAEGRI
jgi:aspartate racemase